MTPYVEQAEIDLGRCLDYYEAFEISRQKDTEVVSNGW